MIPQIQSFQYSKPNYLSNINGHYKRLVSVIDTTIFLYECEIIISIIYLYSLFYVVYKYKNNWSNIITLSTFLKIVYH